MAYNPSPDALSRVPQPVKIDPNAIVENVFANSGVTDTTSRGIMEKYLRDRINPPQTGQRTKVVLGKTGLGIPWPHRVPDGTKQVSRLRRTGNWIISPRVAAAVTFGSLALSVMPTTLLDAADELGVATHRIARVLNPLEPIPVQIAYPEVTPTTITIDAGDISMINGSGEATVSKQKLASLASQVALESDPGDKVIIEITAGSSDDFKTDEDIHRKESKDQDFADERAAVAAAATEEAFTKEGVKITDTKIILDQDVLTLEQKQNMLELANAAGYATITDAINAVQNGEKVNKELRHAVNHLFIRKRGENIQATIIKPGDPEVELKTIDISVMPKDQLPNDPNRDYDPRLILVPPIPEVERYKKIKDKLSWVKKKFHPFAKPITITDQDDKAWVRLRPEALKKDGTLVDEPWAYTGKFEHLMRDGRIEQVLRADFIDENGGDTSLRIMFVDHQPAPTTINAFQEIMRQFAAMQSGRLANKVTGIFVYPESSAGYAHRNPKKIALGVDEQGHEDILGECTPILELAEMHMPTAIGKDKLKKALADFMGPLWTLAHEVGGHGTDIADEKVGLIPVKARGVKNAHITIGTSWGDGLGRVHRTLRSLLPNRDLNNDPVYFDVTVDVVDAQGRPVTRKLRVREDNPILDSVRKGAKIDSHTVTQYAGTGTETDSREHYAESAASIVTGIEVPFREAGVSASSLTTDDGKPAVFARGYYPAERVQRVVRQRIGAEDDSLPVTFGNQPSVQLWVTFPEYDALLRKHMERVRTTPTLPRDKRIAILAELTSSKIKDRPVS